MVRMAVNEEYPSLMPTLYPGVLTTVLRPFGTMDAMRLAFETLAKNKTLAINGETYFSFPVSSNGARPSGPPVMAAARAGRQSPSWQTGSRKNPLVINANKSIPDCLDPWLNTSSKFWPLDERHYAEVQAVCVSIQTDDPPLWSGLLFIVRSRRRTHRKPRPLPELPRRHTLPQAV